MNFPELKIVEFKVSQSYRERPVVEFHLLGDISPDTAGALEQACREGKLLSFMLVDVSKPFPEIIPGTRFDFCSRVQERDHQYRGQVAEVRRVETTTVFR